MHNLRVLSLLFTNNTGAVQGDTLGIMYPLSSISLSCNYNYNNSRVLILYNALDASAAPDIKSIEKSTSLWGGNSEISIGNTS